MFGNCLLCILSTTLFCAITSALNPVVETPSGRIVGTTIYHHKIPVKAFLGIPYAKPPTGHLRFKKPVPIGSWYGTLQAKSFSPGCFQYASSPYPWLDHPPGLSEDCLYLNVWSPINASPQNKKSVMFWIHGGGFIRTSTRIDFYHGQVVAAEGDIIVVTINYRLGAEGFFYTGTEDAPGNMALWDMAEALKWVRDNIESFGGDKGSITLFGQSAGGIAIGMFCVSPVTKGLFKRIILQSGSPVNVDVTDNNNDFETSEKLAKAVGCAAAEDSLSTNPQQVVECMRNIDGFELAIKLSNVTAGSPRGFYPRFGDEFLPKDPRQAVIDGDFDPLDVLIGTNSGEGSLLTVGSMKDVFGFYGEKNPQINRSFGESIIRKYFSKRFDPDPVVELYLGDLKEDDYDEIRYQVFTTRGDFSRRCPTIFFAESFAKKHATVYYYVFTRRPVSSPWAPWMLAAHHDETPFVFGYPLRYPQNYTLEEIALSIRMIQTWSNFAKTGIPTYGTWPLYSKQNPTYQVLGVTNPSATGTGPHRRNCDFFRPYFGL